MGPAGRAEQLSRAGALVALALTVSCAAEPPASKPDAGLESPACNLDPARLDGAPRVSFAQDVMPIFVASCTFGSCHGGTPGRLGFLYLGPAEPPVTRGEREGVHAALLAESQLARGLPRVVPGEPAQSFLLHKLAGTQATEATACDPTGTRQNPCGEEMPPRQTLCLQRSGQGRFDTIAAWVLQGARLDPAPDAGNDR